jgi:phytoene/squalene synthetase
MIDFQLFDIERGDMQSMTELEVYAENTRSLLLYMNLHMLKIDDPNALTAASHIGRCIGICDVLKKLPFYLAMHRGYLPQDILLRVSISLFLLTLNFLSRITSTLTKCGVEALMASFVKNCTTSS